MTAPRSTGPLRILPGDGACALHDVAASRALEAAALARHAPHALMQRAGQAVARLALAVAPHARHVWVACGPGNNGGDGLVAATWLLRAGRSVSATLFGDAQRLPDDARHAWHEAVQAGLSIAPLSDEAPVDLAIDALLGLGAARPPQGAIAGAIARLRALQADILAVDLPSGLAADTGQRLGGDAVVATHTLSLLTLKPGLFTAAGRDHAGQIWLDTLGVDVTGAEATARLTGADVLDGLAPRAHASHKGSFGDLLVLGGAPGMTGAAWLAGRAALAAGAGRVFVSLLEPDAPGQAMALDPARPELMFRRAWWQSAPDTIAAATVVAGCGGGDAVRVVLPRLLSLAPRLVLDADALNAIATDRSLQTLLAARAARSGYETVLTPHPLEAARLLGCDAAAVQRDRLKSAQTLADRWRCVVLLKGSGTLIAAPLRMPHVNPTGNAALATAGTGDVLAGWIAGMWAQGGSADQSFACAVAAAYVQGAAADAESVFPLRSADLVEAMAAVAACDTSSAAEVVRRTVISRVPSKTMAAHDACARRRRQAYPDAEMPSSDERHFREQGGWHGPEEVSPLSSLGISAKINALHRSNRLRSDLEACASQGAANDRRKAMALASHNVAFQHHYAITILIETGLNGSAAALLRPMYESCVNGLWLTYAADEQGLDSFEANRYRPEPSKVLRRLRSHDDGDYVETLERIHACVTEPLNSYVHTGGLQVMRHIGPTFVGPNFSEDGIREYLELADTILIASALELPGLLGIQAEQRLREAVLRYKPTSS